MTVKVIGFLAAATTAIAVSTASAQTSPSAQDVPAHAQHHGGASSTVPALKSAAPLPEADPMRATDPGEKSIQGGSAPPDARDPHDYSDGYTRNAGKYALPPAHRLRFADEHSFGALLVNRLERVDGRDGNATAYAAQAWFGRDYDRLVIKAEGEAARHKLQETRTELLWGHAIAPYWNTQVGVRYDSDIGADRGWFAFGVQGLAPYWFEVDVTAYLGSNGRTALRLEAEYELLITQRLVLQPRVELNVYGKNDDAVDIGSGVSQGSTGLRLRYEFTRQFAPYVGVEWVGKFGRTADLTRAAGERTRDTRLVAGVRVWF